MKVKASYTTGDVEKLFNVSRGTLIKWCNLTLIKYSTIPGSTHRRFSHQAIIDFAKKYDMPLFFEEEVSGGFPKLITRS